jgi:SAM-dependent methyltransferase
MRKGMRLARRLLGGGLSRYISFGRHLLFYRVIRDFGSPMAQKIKYDEAKFLEGVLGDSLPVAFCFDRRDAHFVLNFYREMLPLCLPASHGAYTRSKLQMLREAVQSDELRCQIDLAIGISNLVDGVVERAAEVAANPKYEPEYQRQKAAFHEAYGATLSDFPGDRSRDNTVLHYFRDNSALCNGKRILHVAPEENLSRFLASRAAKYVSLDGFSPYADLQEDVTDLNLNDGSFDLIVCHRVMEHILDDSKAVSEFKRVLDAGGCANISVPLSAHRNTLEWRYSDLSHDTHVRQYGMNFPKIFERQGFVTETVRYGFERGDEAFIQDGTYPMLMFNFRKTGAGDGSPD